MSPDLNSIKSWHSSLKTRLTQLTSFYHVMDQRDRLQEIDLEIQSSENWVNMEKMQAFEKEKKKIESIVYPLESIAATLKDVLELYRLNDESLTEDLLSELQETDRSLGKIEILRMFQGAHDTNDAYLDIQAGSGGTEAQDWAQMLMRMYTRFCESKSFDVKIMDYSAGEVAGIKGCTLYVKGEHAFGWLKSELGVHRLVRKSPFDSGNRRHTSFASVFVSPELDHSIQININPSDLRIDTYRSSGAGGQHVNKTDSAVRITHLPTNTVTQSQNSRSQHQNKDYAMRQLRSKLYEQALLAQQKSSQKIEQEKSDITWGNQIRSYVLDQSRVKDLRTQIEISDVNSILDGKLDVFIEASLNKGVA